MSKIKNIQPKGVFPFMIYLSDRGGVGHIRTILPLTLLGSWRYKQLSFEPTYLAQFISDPKFYKRQNFVKFQRSATEEQLRMLQYFKINISKQTNTSIIYEVDDLIVETKNGEFIPEWNYAHDFYKQRQKYIREMLNIVDGITVSTPYLKQVYLNYNKNISVVKNRLVKSLWGEVKEYRTKKRKKPRILYPGSQNHFGINGRTTEGGDFGKELLKFIQSTKKQYDWIFFGGIPEELKNDKDITYYNWVNYMAYPLFLKSLDADIGLAPLQINDFNHCKSNLKVLEYSMCGIPGVYSYVEPYKKCMLTSETDECMIDQIQSLIKYEDKRYKVWKHDYKLVKNDMYLENNLLKWINEHLKLFNEKILE